MGCDIHAFLELLPKDEKEWLYYGEIPIKRNYVLFSHLAGVRNQRLSGDLVSPKFDLRGFPENAARMTRLRYEEYGEDVHSEGWLYSHEFNEVIGAYCSDPDAKYHHERMDYFRWDSQLFPNFWLFGNSMTSWKPDHPDFPGWISEYRVVFWFDN